MITLSSIASRIEQLETEEFSTINTRLDTWYAMVQWQFFVAQYDDAETAKKVLHSLPNDHPMRVAAGKLTWFTCYFANALPDVTWKSEKAEIAFAAWLEEAIAEGFTESALCCETAMNDAIEFVAECLQNGSLDFYDKRKKQQQEFWELQQTYRRMANFGELTPESEEWLKENDTSFWENYIKKQSEVKPEVKPAASETIENLGTMVPALPQNEAHQPVASGPVTVKYRGGLRGFSLETVSGTRAIEPGDVITVPPFVWENIQSGVMPKSWWVRLNG